MCIIYLWLQVPMYDSFEVHKVDRRDQFFHQFSSFHFGKPLLFSYPLQKFSSFEVFHDDVGMSIILEKRNRMSQDIALETTTPNSRLT